MASPRGRSRTGVLERRTKSLSPSSRGTQLSSRSALAEMNDRVTVLENSVKDMGHHFRDLATALAQEFAKVIVMQNEQEAKLQSSMKDLAHELAMSAREDMMKEIDAEIKNALSVIHKDEVLCQAESESTTASEDSEIASTAQQKECNDSSCDGSVVDCKDQSQEILSPRPSKVNIPMTDAVEDSQTILKRSVTTVDGRELTEDSTPTLQGELCKTPPEATDHDSLFQAYLELLTLEPCGHQSGGVMTLEPCGHQSRPGSDSISMSPTTVTSLRPAMTMTPDTLWNDTDSLGTKDSHVACASPGAAMGTCVAGSGAMQVGGQQLSSGASANTPEGPPTSWYLSLIKGSL